MDQDPFSMMMMLGGMSGGGNYSPEEAGQNPFGGSGGASGAMSRQLAPLRAMSYINRDSRSGMQTPRTPRGSQMSQMLGGGGDGMDYSQFTFDPEAHDAATKFLGQYGLQPLDPSQVKQNTVLPNTSFLNNHPRLSGMLEGGIYGAAASRGSNTWGEGIQSVADSLIAGPRMRAAAYNQQFERPFQAAHMLEGMQDVAQKRELTEAQIQRERATTEAIKNKPDPLSHITPISRDAAGWVDNTTNEFHQNPGYDPKEAAQRSQNTPGVAPVLRHIRALYGNVDPDSLTKEQWGKVNKAYANEQGQIAGDRSGAGTRARIDAEYQMGAKEPAEVKQKKDQEMKGWLDPKNKQVRSSIRNNAALDPKINKFLTDAEIDQEILKHNTGVASRTQKIHDDWVEQYNQQNPKSPMPY